MVGIKDIAKKVGCSEATVSLAMNNSPLVNKNTKKERLKIADEIGYIPNLSARALARKKSGCLGLIIPDIENVFYSSLVNYINHAAVENGYKLIIAVSENNAESENHIISTMIENRVEGVIFVPMNVSNSNNAYISQLEDYKIPFVFCSDYYEEYKDKAPVVMSDLENGMYELVKKVISLGYKNIAYLTGDNSVKSLHLRTKGFNRAIEECGVNCNIVKLDKLNYNAAQKVVKLILKEHPEIDAFVGINDMVAIGIINALSELGINVPEEKGVVGFDNVIFSKVSYPRITTIEQDIEMMANECVEMLINGKKNDYIIPTKYIERDSIKSKD